MFQNIAGKIELKNKITCIFQEMNFDVELVLSRFMYHVSKHWCEDWVKKIKLPLSPDYQEIYFESE